MFLAKLLLLAKAAGEYLKKGSQIYVEGKLRTRKWTDKEGIDRYTTEIVGQEMQMLGKKASNEGPSAPNGDAPLDASDDNENPFRPGKTNQCPGLAGTFREQRGS